MSCPRAGWNGSRWTPSAFAVAGPVTAIAAEIVNGAPVLYVGGGVIRARASESLRRLAELTGIPVVTTLMARGAFPDSHRLHMGMPGMHGTVAAVGALQKSDLLITLGARFDDRVTGKLSTFAPNAGIIHADIDPAEIGKNRYADVPIVGDCKEVITELIEAIRADIAEIKKRVTAVELDLAHIDQPAMVKRFDTLEGKIDKLYDFLLERLTRLPP